MPDDGDDSQHDCEHADGSQDLELAHGKSFANRRQLNLVPNPDECC